jgi:hypothetical protein
MFSFKAGLFDQESGFWLLYEAAHLWAISLVQGDKHRNGTPSLILTW